MNLNIEFFSNYRVFLITLWFLLKRWVVGSFLPSRLRQPFCWMDLRWKLVIVLSTQLRSIRSFHQHWTRISLRTFQQSCYRVGCPCRWRSWFYQLQGNLHHEQDVGDFQSWPRRRLSMKVVSFHPWRRGMHRHQLGQVYKSSRLRRCCFSKCVLGSISRFFGNVAQLGSIVLVRVGTPCLISW